MPLSLWLCLGVILLVVLLAGFWQLTQRNIGQQQIDTLIACPTCGAPLDLRTVRHSHEGQVASDEVIETCAQCGYESEEFMLKYPLEAEIHELLGREEQATRIAMRGAKDAWLRRKKQSTSF